MHSLISHLIKIKYCYMKLMNILYRTKSVCKKFHNQNPDQRIIVAEPSKVIASTKHYSNLLKMNWFVSKRTNSILTDSFIYIGKNKIDKNSVKNLKITYFKSFFNLLSYQVVCFDYNNLHYYIGMRFSPIWEDSLSVNSIEKINKKITFSHLLFIGLMIYLLISVTKKWLL